MAINTRMILNIARGCLDQFDAEIDFTTNYMQHLAK